MKFVYWSLDFNIIQFFAMDESEMCRFPEIKKDTNEIISQYARICDGLYKWIKSKRDSVEDLKYLIQSWLHLETINMHDSNRSVTQDEIESMESVHKLWRVFSSYNSFFNFELVERAINIMDYEEGKESLGKYKSLFNNYLKRKVNQCPSNIGMKGNNHMVIVVKLDKAFSDCRMEHLLQLGKDIGKVVHVTVDKIQLDGVTKGSVCVIFHLLKHAVPQGFFLMDDDIIILKNVQYQTAKILSIRCGNLYYRVNSEKGKLLQ